VDRQITALLCRTSDRGTGAATGTKELAGLVGARIIGSPGEPRSSCWEDDLRDSRGCLLEAGGQVDDTFVAGRAPILLAGECSVAVATLPVVVRHHPDVRPNCKGWRCSFTSTSTSWTPTSCPPRFRCPVG